MTDTVRKRHEDDVPNMTDDELIDSWQMASKEEIDNPSPFLRSVIDEMTERDIPCSSDPRAS
ncbi:hypothetical protein A0U87_23120 [Sphingobium sp. MP9-4]|uniref:hypothetical protein n=1 Tax=Sphingobium sp. MP9-4 TaxID=1761936 RepID=UPI0010CA6D93|nr:hypothetical protein [Sphingobium sp. MP9-4]TKV40921.1 hypothetical protein A0U87_23120 [Sphingobium sp. MP9-4]